MKIQVLLDCCDIMIVKLGTVYNQCGTATQKM